MKIQGDGKTDFESLRAELLGILLEKSFRLGEFTLSSGAKSDYYIDGRVTSLNPEGAYRIGRLFLEECIGLGADAVGGLTLGADPIVGAVVALSAHSPKPLRGFIVRKKQKEHGAGKLTEGELLEGDVAVVVEDVVTSGASAMRAVEAARGAGAAVPAVLAVVDREEGGARLFEREGILFKPLFTAAELKKAARDRK